MFVFKRRFGRRRTIGLDVGAQAAKAVVLSGRRGHLKLDALGSEPLVGGAIVDGHITEPEPVARAISKLFRDRRIEDGRLVAGVGDNSVIIRNIVVASTSEEEFAEAVEWHVEEHIPFDIGDVSIGYHIVDVARDSMRVLFACCKRAALAGRRRAIESEGRRLSAVEPEALALVNCYAFNYGPVDESPVALVDIGASKTIINVVRGARADFTRHVSVGGDQFTSRVQRALDLTFEQAEAAKLGGVPDIRIERHEADGVLDALSKALSFESDFEALLEGEYDLLKLEIQSTLDFYHATSDDGGTVRKIFVSGGCSRLKGLKEFLSSGFEMPIERLDPFRRIKIDGRRFNADDVSAAGPEMAVAVGLALSGADPRQASINLLDSGAEVKAPIVRPKEKASSRTYTFKGRNRLGEVVSGERVADSREALRQILRREQLSPSTIREKSILPALPRVGFMRKSVGAWELERFTRELSAMFDAGLPLQQSFDMLAEEQKNGHFRRVLEEISNELGRGATLEYAFERHPKVFDCLYFSMIKAGERGGILDITLASLAEYLGRVSKLRRDVRLALLGPSAALVSAAAVAFMLLALTTNDGDTSGVLADTVTFGGGVGGAVILAVAVVVAVALGLFAYHGTRRGRRLTDALLLKLPGLGSLLREHDVARFARVTSTLLGAGVPILTALDAAAGSAGNVVFEEAIKNLHDGVERGESLGERMALDDVLPQTLAAMVSRGEQTGALDTTFGKIADLYEQRVDAKVASLPLAFVPVILVLFILATALIVLYV